MFLTLKRLSLHYFKHNGDIGNIGDICDNGDIGDIGDVGDIAVALLH